MVVCFIVKGRIVRREFKGSNRKGLSVWDWVFKIGKVRYKMGR